MCYISLKFIQLAYNPVTAEDLKIWRGARSNRKPLIEQFLLNRRHNDLTGISEQEPYKNLKFVLPKQDRQLIFSSSKTEVNLAEPKLQDKKVCRGNFNFFWNWLHISLHLHQENTLTQTSLKIWNYVFKNWQWNGEIQDKCLIRQLIS